MLRLDPTEAPGRASTQEHFSRGRAHPSSTTGKQLGSSRLGPRGTSGTAALRTFRISSTSGPLPEGPGSSQHVFHMSEALVTPTESPAAPQCSQRAGN